MKNLFRVSTIIGGCVLLASCGQLMNTLTPTAMDTPEASRKVVEALGKYIDTTEYKPIEIWWSETDELSNDLGLMIVYMVSKDGKPYNQTFGLGGQVTGPLDIKPDVFHKGPFDFATMAWIRPSELNPELIQKHYEAAKAEVPAEYTYKGIHEYTIEIDDETGLPERTFKMNMIETGKSEVTSAGRTVTEYYELNFKGLDDGSIESID